MASTSNRFVIFVTSGVALLAGLLYLNALHNPFVYDDYHTVVANQSLTHVFNLRAIVLHDMTRPIINFSYAVDRAVWGAAPFGYHLTNVLLHIVNVVLLFLLAWAISEDPVVASATSVLLAVHPMMTEAVGYISGRSEVLSMTFLLMGLLCGRQWIKRGEIKWGVLTLVVWIAMLATKELGAMFPFILFAYDVLLGGGSSVNRKRRVATVYLPIVVLAVLAGLARVAILSREYPGQVAVHWSYLLIAIDVVRRYASLLIVPSGQTIFHSVASMSVLRAIVALGVVGALLALGWLVRRSQPLITFGLLTFFLLLVPSTVLIVLDQGEPMAEHRVYAASVGFFLAVGGGIGALSAWLTSAGRSLRWVAGAGMVLVGAALAGQTVVRNHVWANPIALWQESVDLAPDHYRPRLLLGEALQDRGRRNEAAEQYRTAISLRPTDPTGHVKLGGCLAEMGDLEAAKQHFLEALRIDPSNTSARQALGILNEMESHPAGDSGRR